MVVDKDSTGYRKPDQTVVNSLEDVANRLRIHSVRATTASKSGHPTSCSSMAEITSVLFFHTMRYSIDSPRDASHDRFILSKGHAAPILYAAWAEAGLFSTDEVLKLRKIDSDLEGHPTPRLNFVDVATGSLGQGLSIAAGMAYVGKYIDKADYRTYCLVGDGESAEGSIWEALSFAAHYKLDNLCVIFDVNRLGQSEATAHGHDLEMYRKRLDGFGFNALVVEGHDVDALCKAFHEAEVTKGQPTALIAKTYKGRNFPKIENEENWHGKPLGVNSDSTIQHLESLLVNPGTKLHPPAPPAHKVEAINMSVSLATQPAYTLGECIATRLAYGTALLKLSENNPRVIGLDGDTKNSTFSDKLNKKYPERFIEGYIAEQNLVGVGVGVACRDRTIAFISTFAAFFSRAFDQIRMGAISQTNINCVGSHAGISIGEDGPSQMALEDLAMFRSIPGSTVFYPSDAVSTERAAELAANKKGVCFIRTSRPNVPVLYANDEPFQIGKCKVVRQSAGDVALVIGCCVTLVEAVAAAEELEKSGVHIRVLDPFTIKPIDAEGIISNAKQCGGRIITVEDHYEPGGVGEAVCAAVSMEKGIIVKKLSVTGIPRSGPSAVLLDMFGISRKQIVAAVQEIQKL